MPGGRPYRFLMKAPLCRAAALIGFCGALDKMNLKFTNLLIFSVI
jgi:hypothetical protein